MSRDVSWTTFDGGIGVNQDWLPRLGKGWTIRRLKLNAMRSHGYFPIPACDMEPWVEIPERAFELECLYYFERRGKKGRGYEGKVLTLEVN